MVATLVSCTTSTTRGHRSATGRLPDDGEHVARREPEPKSSADSRGVSSDQQQRNPAKMADPYSFYRCDEPVATPN